MKTVLSAIVILLFLFVGVWIAQDNSQLVAVTLLGFPLADLPLGLGLLFAFAAGLAIGLLITVPVLWRLRRRNRKLHRESVALSPQ